VNAPQTPAVDPIVVEIVRGALKACGDEMESVLVRTSMSPFIREKGDHFSGLADAKARIIYTTHDRAGPGMLETIFEKYPPESMKPGDVYWVSDPYILKGAISHTPDMCFISPAFFGKEIVGYSLCFGHFWDIGGIKPGSLSPHATSVFQEGIVVPQVRIVNQGELNEDLYRTILRNSRFPDMLEGDTRAMMAASKLGQTRLLELFERYGRETMEVVLDELHHRNERYVRKTISDTIKPGRYAFADYVDDDCVTDTPYRVALEAEFGDGEIRWVDGTKSDNQAQGPINYLMHDDLCRMIFSRFVLSLEGGGIYQNQGAYRPVGEIRLRPGSILQPIRPAPVGLRAHTLWRIVNVVLGIYAQATGGKTPAGSPDYVIISLHATDPKTGETFLCTDGIGVGQGARAYADGLDVIYLGKQKNYPIEFLEGAYAVRVERFGIQPDSGGPGRYRGGLGVTRDYRVLADRVILATRMANRKSPAWGVAGGKVGRTGVTIINPGQPDERRIEGFSEGIVLKHGDLIRVITAGGGGYGDPLDREVELVVDDVIDGFVSLASASKDYGVVIDEASQTVDEAATEKLRAQMRKGAGKPAFFDRGAVYEALERERANRAA
jgi:N-methylhydantoinase B